MIITILGIGNVGTAMAADLKLKGHDVRLLKTSGLHNDHYDKMISNGGQIALIEKGIEQKVTIDLITNNYKDAIKDADLLILCVQTNYHERIIKEMSPFLKDGQAILIEPGYLSTTYFLKYCSSKNLTIIEAQSSPIDCRITSPGKVSVLYRNVQNPVGVFPLASKKYAINILSQLNFNFIFLDSVIEAALHNPNLIVHTVGAIFSIPRIEYTKGEYWMYREVFTPHIWNIVQSLDKEKMNILEKLGFERLSYVEACKIRNSEDKTRDATEVFFDYARNHSPKGPNIPDSRYITEDVPEGLVLLESLGEILDVQTPTCSSLINISSVALKKEFRSIGRSIERVGEANINVILNDK